MRSSNWPPNCIVPLQIAQVQVSTELLEVSGMESKDSSPKTVTRDGPAFAMRFESHFKSSFGNVKAFNLKKIKIIAEPVAAMAAGGPAAGGRWQANSLGRA